MGSPFDEVVETEKKYQEKKLEKAAVKKEEVKENIKTEKKTGKDTINVAFSINKKWLERIFFILIIMVELYFILVNPICGMDNLFTFGGEDNSTQKLASTKTDAKQQTTAKNATNAQTATSSTATAPKPATPPATSAPQTTQTPENPNLPFEGNFDFSILEILYDQNDEGDPSKMNSVQFSMSNRWKSFKPMIRIYWYDSKSQDSLGKTVRAEKVLPEIKKGTTQTITVSEFKSRFFYPEEASETIKIELYDSSNTQLLTSATKTIS
jgi:hypothetical protein